MKALARLAAKKTLRVAGLMSGTSADGVDVAIVDIDEGGVKLRAFDTVPYPAGIRRDVLKLCEARTVRVDEVSRLNFALGEVFASALIEVAAGSRIALERIDLIGSHGQTVRHLPGGVPPSTLQIAEPSVIAERTGITTVADFRPRDVAAGGQGAPLVPYADYVLFRDAKKSRAVQNIGGIANVTYLPAASKVTDIVAFDTGPGNMVIDHVVRLATRGRRTYDASGAVASKGTVNRALLSALMRHRFLRRRPPKSTGREEFGRLFSERLYARARRRRIRPSDLLATVTAFTARSIARAYLRFITGPIDEVILSGGGAHNRTLVGMLKAELAANARGPAPEVLLSDACGITVDAKEAVAFAILARETIRGACGNVPSATGARRPVVLGKIIPA